MSNYHRDSTSAVDDLFVVWSSIPPLILHYAFEHYPFPWHMNCVSWGTASGLGTLSLRHLRCPWLIGTFFKDSLSLVINPEGDTCGPRHHPLPCAPSQPLTRSFRQCNTGFTSLSSLRAWQVLATALAKTQTLDRRFESGRLRHGVIYKPTMKGFSVRSPPSLLLHLHP